MTIQVKHSKVSTIPDTDDTSLVRPSDWNADHTLVGIIDVPNGGTGASTLTGYVKGNGTSAMTASATVPSTDITGLGTMSTQNANAVAITGGTINGTTIGATTPSSIVGTTITGQTGRLNGTGQNLLVRSQEFNDAAWNKSNVTVTANTTVAPDSTTTADTATASAGNSQHDAGLQGITVLSGFAYTVSVFAKAGTNNFIQFCVNGDGAPFANFDLSTGVVGTSSTGTSSIVASTNGFYRCVFTYTTTSATAYPIIDIVPLSNSVRRPTWNAAGTETVILWGAQLELGSTANTYIPTTTTAVYGTPNLSFSGVSTLGLESNGALFLQPAGTGAIQAQATTSTAAGGNVRGANAVDWQTSRSTAATRVASGTNSVLSGGNNNSSTAFCSTTSGGESNQATSTYTFVGSGTVNTSSGVYASIVGGHTNTSAGYFNFIGNGYGNTGTANGAVTTQSATMNATTAVTLSGSNANIKVGQLITGTSINNFPNTYVAAISGTSLTLSQNASGSSTSTLSFFTPHGVVVGGGNNQATGSYSFIGGGGDAGTAANRNVASGSWSAVCGGAKNIASGSGSFVGGGGTDGVAFYVNTASGNGSSVLGGFQNTASNVGAVVTGGYLNAASGLYSTAIGGTFTTTRGIAGNVSISASQNPISGSAGVSQTSILILGKQTTDATATVITSDGSAAGTTNQVILPNNSAYFFRGEVVSGKTAAGDTKGWTIEGVIKRGANAASTALVGVPTVTSTYADLGAATWDIAVTADTTNGGIRVTFTGQAATTIRTVCQIRTTEMTF